MEIGWGSIKLTTRWTLRCDSIDCGSLRRQPQTPLVRVLRLILGLQGLLEETIKCGNVPAQEMEEGNWRNQLSNRLIEAAGIPILRIWKVVSCDFHFHSRRTVHIGPLLSIPVVYQQLSRLAYLPMDSYADINRIPQSVHEPMPKRVLHTANSMPVLLLPGGHADICFRGPC